MATTQDRLLEEAGSLKLDDSLLFLNHLLAVARGEKADRWLADQIRTRKAGVPAFLVHFLAKQLLLHASNLCIYQLDWRRYERLLDLYFQLDDPISNDPNWKQADPSGLFERLLGQQIPSQRRNAIQKYGLALGIFRDTGPVQWPISYSLKDDIERLLGMPIEKFMAMGHLCYALRAASVRGQACGGSFTPMLLAEAYRQGVDFSIPEVWDRFLLRAACDRDTFRTVCRSDLYRVKDARYFQFEFNPLCRFPITMLGDGRYLAVDPNLIVERTTFGLFYDLFERDGPAFSDRFGYVFDEFIGTLLASVCPADSLWSAAAWEREDGKKPKNRGKIGDRAYKGTSCTVLLECKSLRPSLELTTYGSDESVQAARKRIVSALEQMIEHGAAIRQGQWKGQGLSPGPVACVVVTYGRIQTINGPFMRKRIRQQLADKGLEVPPFVILSLEEFDVAIRLVELGHALDEVILTLANEQESFDPLRKYADTLQSRAVSTLTYDKGKAFMDGIVDAGSKQCAE
jgi:hypothetical protein